MSVVLRSTGENGVVKVCLPDAYETSPAALPAQSDGCSGAEKGKAPANAEAL